LVWRERERVEREGGLLLLPLPYRTTEHAVVGKEGANVHRSLYHCSFNAGLLLVGWRHPSIQEEEEEEEESFYLFFSLWTPTLLLLGDAEKKSREGGFVHFLLPTTRSTLSLSLSNRVRVWWWWWCRLLKEEDIYSALLVFFWVIRKKKMQYFCKCWEKEEEENDNNNNHNPQSSIENNYYWLDSFFWPNHIIASGWIEQQQRTI
jgi:hypothetical protein